MLRHPQNHNLTLHYDNAYQGLPVMYEKGPFIREHLQRLHETMQRALDQHPRTFAFRVELKFPSSGMLPSYAFTNEVISRFFESFKAKIEHSRSMARRRNRYAHDCKVRYVWVREIGDSERPHYHLVILLNKDAYSVLGHFASERNNMFNRLEEAWASALRLPRDAVVGLVHPAPGRVEHHEALLRGLRIQKRTCLAWAAEESGKLDQELLRAAACSIGGRNVRRSGQDDHRQAFGFRSVDAWNRAQKTLRARAAALIVQVKALGGMPVHGAMITITFLSGLRKTLDLIEYDKFLKEDQPRMRAEGKHPGIGIVCFTEGTAVGPYEGARVTVHARDEKKAQSVAALVAGSVGRFPPQAGSWDLLVNCTPVGMHPRLEQSPIPSSALGRGRALLRLGLLGVPRVGPGLRRGPRIARGRGLARVHGEVVS